MPRLQIGEASLYYEVHGTGPAVVFVHGVGGNHAAWFQQVPVFSQSYSVVTYDQRGFGLTTDPEALGRNAFVSDLAALLDHLGLSKVALVGQSMGGGSCVGFAAAYPERVAALVLSDTVQGFEEFPDLAQIMSSARAATDSLSQIERVLSAGTRATQPALCTLYSQIASFNTVDRRSLPGRFGPLIAPEALAAKRVPVLFIVGQEDCVYPPAAVRAVHERMPGSIYVEITAAGHSPYFERPAEFNDSVLSFLQAMRYRGRSAPAHSNAAGYREVT